MDRAHIPPSWVFKSHVGLRMPKYGAPQPLLSQASGLISIWAEGEGPPPPRPLPGNQGPRDRRRQTAHDRASQNEKAAGIWKEDRHRKENPSLGVHYLQQSKANLQAHYGNCRRGKSQKVSREQGNWKWKLESPSTVPVIINLRRVKCYWRQVSLSLSSSFCS